MPKSTRTKIKAYVIFVNMKEITELAFHPPPDQRSIPKGEIKACNFLRERVILPKWEKTPRTEVVTFGKRKSKMPQEPTWQGVKPPSRVHHSSQTN